MQDAADVREIDRHENDDQADEQRKRQGADLRSRVYEPLSDPGGHENLRQVDGDQPKRDGNEGQGQADKRDSDDQRRDGSGNQHQEADTEPLSQLPGRARLDRRVEGRTEKPGEQQSDDQRGDDPDGPPEIPAICS